MDRRKLKELKISADNAERLCTAVGMMNTIGLSIDKRIVLDIEYRRASNAAFAAKSAYIDAIESAARE